MQNQTSISPSEVPACADTISQRCRFARVVHHMRVRASAIFVGLVLLAGSARGENWPHWRGPTGDGVSAEKNLPTTWSETENLAWKTQLAGLGGSSPIVYDELVFVTSQTGKTRTRPGNPTLARDD